MFMSNIRRRGQIAKIMFNLLICGKVISRHLNTTISIIAHIARSLIKLTVEHNFVELYKWIVTLKATEYVLRTWGT